MMQHIIIIKDKILKNRAYEMAMTPKYDAYQRGLASIVSIYVFLLRKCNREQV